MILLWQFESCPYCAKVRSALMQYHIDFVSIDASTSKAKSFLKSIGGKSQVPFIIDTKNHEMLYESDDIIKYLRLV